MKVACFTPAPGWLLMVRTVPTVLMALMAFATGSASAQALPADLNLKLSCGLAQGEGDGRAFFSDSGEIEIRDGQLKQFRWESSLHRGTHGFDCSIDLDDQLELDVVGAQWRVQLRDVTLARAARGYDTLRGESCIIRLIQRGEYLLIEPACAALCGSRSNFSELRIHQPSGRCDYPAHEPNTRPKAAGK